MLTSKALEGFILSKSSDGLSPNTASIYRWALDKLVAFTHDKPIEDVTTEDLRSWLSYLRNDYQNSSPSRKSERLSAASLQDAWTAAKSFCRWCSETFSIPNAADGLKRPAGESPVIVPLNEDDIRALLKAAGHITTKAGKRKTFTSQAPNAKRNTALLLVMLDTGVRVGELCRLKIRDVILKSGECTVTLFGSGRKTKARQVYLGKSARRAVWLYLAEREDGQDGQAPLFVTTGGKAMTKFSVGLVLRRLGKRAGVANVHPHRMRHTFAVCYLRNGGDVFTLQRILGHSSMEMVRRYLLLANTDDAEAHRKASPADHWRL
jgi:integrase/recombinase XerD